jgi:hypothetical protein
LKTGTPWLAAMGSASPVPPEASPSAVQHSTNSAGLSSEVPSTWNTFRVWSAWTKAESPAKAGWCAAAIVRALSQTSGLSVPGWNSLAEPRQPAAGRKICGLRPAPRSNALSAPMAWPERRT